MSYIKQSDAIDNHSHLTMEEVSEMYIDYIVRGATQIQSFNGHEWINLPPHQVFHHKVSIMWSIGAKKTELLQEGDNFVVLKDHFEKDLNLQVLKFIKE